MATRKDRVLWADDEIDLLKPHMMFLREKGYEVVPVVSGQDAIDCCREQAFDIIFLDENMPGLTGLETLSQIKEIAPNVPVVMVTKSEEESIMNQAIGNKIADYLIKPVNPNQLLLSIKKNVHKNVIISEAATVGYQQEFARIGTRINDSLTADEWMDLYKKLVYWELELENSQVAMLDMLRMQKEEANNAFAKFVKKNYEDWIRDPDDRPLMSPDLFKKRVFPMLDTDVLFQREPVLQHPPDRYAIRAQRDLLRPDARPDRADVPGPVGGRGERGGQEPERGSADTDANRPFPEEIHVLL